MNAYEQQLEDKIHRIQQQFADVLREEEFLVFRSPEQHFRQRAEFRLWHVRDEEGKNTGEAFYAMFAPGQKASAKTLQRVDQLPIASERINELMPKLLAAVRAEPVLLSRLFQVEFLSTLRGNTLITLIYHKPLDLAWESAARKLESELGVWLIGRSRKQKVVLSQDFVTESLRVRGTTYRYRQMEGGFTQPNASVCEYMLEWACDAAAKIALESPGSDLLELYCGNGNFSLPLAKHFRRVLATEVSKTSVACGRHNISENESHNVAIARLSAEEITQAMSGERTFKRLAQDGINVGQYEPSTIFVDPPRAGVDDDTLSMMQGFRHILYISCNPDTLRANLDKLLESHDVIRMALFDQFPYTHHVEMGVWLRRR